MAEMAPKAVAARLDALRQRVTCMTADEARAAMTPPPAQEPFPVAAGRRLEELRALMELTGHLQRRASPASPGRRACR
jgi:hypothetical protein